ncbi:MAG: ABC transporter permease [Ruminococcus sp.]|nr:ABC transporter permease [Ruminococcus sp.]
MQVYKTFNKILLKNIGIVIMYIGIFLGISIATVNSTSEKTEYTDSKPNVIVNDLDESEESEEFCKYLEEEFRVSYDKLSDRELTDKLYYMQTAYYLQIEDGFGEKLSQGKTDSILSHKTMDGSVSDTLIGSKIDMYISTAKAFMASGESVKDALVTTNKTLADKSEVTMLEKEEKGGGIANYYQFIPYLMLCSLIFSLCTVIIIITRGEIKRRTFSSGLRPIRFLSEIALGSGGFIALIYLLCCVFIPIVILGADVNKELVIMMLNALAFTIFVAMLVLFISNVLEKKALVSMVGNVIGLGMSFICGVFVPMNLLSDGVRKVGMFLPAYWYEVLNYSLAGNGDEGYSDSLAVKCIAIQLIFALAMFLATLAVIKVKQSKKTGSSGSASGKAAAQA